MQEHRFIRFMSEGDKGYKEKYGAKDVEMYQKFMNDVYDQTDRYLGRFVHLLDEGWTIIITSDHAQVCPAHQFINAVADVGQSQRGNGVHPADIKIHLKIVFQSRSPCVYYGYYILFCIKLQ